MSQGHDFGAVRKLNTLTNLRANSVMRQSPGIPGRLHGSLASEFAAETFKKQGADDAAGKFSMVEIRYHNRRGPR